MLAKYLSSAARNTGYSGATAANNVIDEWKFRSSERPSI